MSIGDIFCRSLFVCCARILISLPDFSSRYLLGNGHGVPQSSFNESQVQPELPMPAAHKVQGKFRYFNLRSHSTQKQEEIYSINVLNITKSFLCHTQLFLSWEGNFHQSMYNSNMSISQGIVSIPGRLWQLQIGAR